MAEFFDALVQRVRHWSILDQLYRIRWILVGFAALILIAIPWGLRAEERGLENATREALTEAGISADSIAFSGRSGTITATMTNAELRKANAVVADVSGVRTFEFVLLKPARPQTPSTTMTPPATVAPAPGAPSIVPSAPVRAAMLHAAVGDSRLELSGTLPTSGLLADVTRVGNALYGPNLRNTMIVDNRVAPEASLRNADEVLTALPMISYGTLHLDDSGATIDVTVETEVVALALTQRLEDLLGPDVPVTGTIAVSAGSLPELDVAIADGQALRVSGAVNNESLQAAIRGAVQDATGNETADSLVVDPLAMETYETLRAPRLLKFVTGARDSILQIDGHDLQGSMVEGETWPMGAANLTPPVWNLNRVLAAMVAGDPSTHLTVTVDSPRLESGEADLELSYRRVESIELSLMRAGVEPNRMTVGVGDGLGSSLRFRLASADDLE